jgi:hypothetical protein
MKTYLQKTTSAAPLAVFRIALGLLLFAGMVRFWSKGWIEELYIKPKYFFSFYGFGFVTPIGEYTYLIFAVCALSALLVAAGFFYRVSTVTLFLSFSYIELIDKSTYLNHYYFISMVLLIMIFLPAQVSYSVDARRQGGANDEIPRWCIDTLKLFICIVYVYAGLAKINSDWLLHAYPLQIWLPAKNDLPVIGSLFNYKATAFAFSWLGCIYDLAIPFLLLYAPTRLLAYCAVIIFHLLTAILFPIGMFPYVMIATALIFFSADVHNNLVNKVSSVLRIRPAVVSKGQYFYSPRWTTFLIFFFGVFFIVQLTLPFRHLLYSDELFWTEEGYRFSWRVMLMEKAGTAEFTIKDVNGKQVVADNNEFLTPLQQKMMATQPDMILQYAHILRDHYAGRGFQSPGVFVDSYVTLNGRLGKPLIDPQVDLAQEEDSFRHKAWILPFENDIKGF